jgi:hypothetical protein
VIRSGVSLDKQDVAAADENGRRDAGAAGRRPVSRRRHEPRPRWGVVNCPDGPHRVDLAIVRRAMTRMLVAGELGYDVITDLGKKAGVSRSTVSRVMRGRPAGFKSVQAVLRVLQLPYEDVVSAEPAPDALTAAEGVEE